MRKYCVYYHLMDNVVFYVGSGTKSRAFAKNNRSKDWLNITKNQKYDVVILQDNLSLEEARSTEAEEILKFDSLINKRQPKKFIKNTPFEVVSKFVEYDETSPTFLRWKIANGPRSSVGEPAGSLTFKDGLPRSSYITIDNVGYKLSRVVWVLHNKHIDNTLLVDHQDGNPHNNNIDNLRLASHAINSRNIVNKNNGVCFRPKRKKSGECYYSYVTFEGNRYSKTFSISTHGDNAYNLAVSWREEMIDQLNSSYSAGFTDRHKGSR